MSNFREGLVLLLSSWGWDLDSEKVIEEPKISRVWQNYPVRFYKAARSCLLIGTERDFQSMKKFALYLGKDRIGRSSDGIRAQKLFELPGSEDLPDPGHHHLHHGHHLYFFDRFFYFLRKNSIFFASMTSYDLFLGPRYP
jgi:hypothetical protein